jgi:hypothetical protein
MKKGQGLSLNVIIIAAIALIVLVILSVIFIGRAGKTTNQVEQCPGQCIDGENSNDCKEAFGEYYMHATDKSCFDTTDNTKTDEICCVGVGGSNEY